MKITKSELRNMIKESVDKYKNQYFLQRRLNEVKEELKKLNEDDSYMQPNEVEQEVQSETKPKEQLSNLGKAKEIIALNFESVTIKLEKQLGDLFKVIDAAESKKILDGDYIRLEGNDFLEKGKTYKFIIYRETPLKYETNPIESWSVLK